MKTILPVSHSPLTPFWGTFGHVSRHGWLSQEARRRRGYEYQVGRDRAAAKHPIMLRIARTAKDYLVQDDGAEVEVEKAELDA